MDFSLVAEGLVSSITGDSDNQNDLNLIIRSYQYSGKLSEESNSVLLRYSYQSSIASGKNLHLEKSWDYHHLSKHTLWTWAIGVYTNHHRKSQNCETYNPVCILSATSWLIYI